MKKPFLLFLALGSLMISCQPKTTSLPLIPAANFETVVDDKPVALYTLTNANGVTAQITNYGGRVVSLWVPDRDGNFRDVVQGFDTIADYMDRKSGNQGATVGRFANRIENRRFTLDDTEYLLSGNPEAMLIQIGYPDFNRAVFDAKPLKNSAGEEALELHYLSPDGEAGFPGNLDVTVTFTLTADNALRIDYKATTDKPTVVSLTNHSFFNLSGEGNGDILDYDLYINADYYLGLKEGTIPTGEILPVEGTPLDFRTPQKIGLRIDEDYPPLVIGDGYDQCWVLNLENGGITHVASMSDPESGVVMDVLTNQPGMQVYAGNKLNGLIGKGGHVYNRRTGIALETMHFPDSPNHDNFPSPVLRPGEVYDQTCIYRFSVK